MMSRKDFMITGCEVPSTDEQAQDSNDSIDLDSLFPPMPELNHFFNLSPSPFRNLGNMEDDDYTVPDEDLQDYLNDDVTLDADSAFAVARNLSPAPVDMASFIPVTPTGPPKQQSIRAGWEFHTNVILSEERATIRYWRSQKWLFVERNTPFSVQFSLTPFEGSGGISDWFVRCTAVCTDPEYEHSVVRRCGNRIHNCLPAEGALGIVEVVEDEAWYCGSGARNTHYSVVVPLQVPSMTARYQMTCTRKCPLPSVNYRDLALDFTAEDRSALLYEDSTWYCVPATRNTHYSFVVPGTSARYQMTRPMVWPYPGVDRQALALDFTAEDRRGAVYARDRILVRPCAKPKRDLKIEKRRLAKQNMDRARSAQPEEEPRRSKRRRELTPPVEDQVAPMECSATEDDSEMCLLRLKQAARYNKDEDIDQQIKSIIKNVQQKNNLE